MRVWYKMDGDGVDTDSDKLVTPAAKAVEAGCPICLESFEDKAFVDVCFHILFNSQFDNSNKKEICDKNVLFIVEYLNC